MSLNGIHGFVRHGICEVLLRRAVGCLTLTSEEVAFLPSSEEGRKTSSLDHSILLRVVVRCQARKFSILPSWKEGR